MKQLFLCLLACLSQLPAADWHPDDKLADKLDEFFRQVPAQRRHPDCTFWPEGRILVDNDIEWADRLAIHGIALHNHSDCWDTAIVSPSISPMQFSMLVLWYRQHPGAVAVTLRRLADPETPLLLARYHEFDSGPGGYALRHGGGAKLLQVDAGLRPVMPATHLDPLVSVMVRQLEAVVRKGADLDDQVARLTAADRHPHPGMDQAWRDALAIARWRRAAVAKDASTALSEREKVAAWAQRSLLDDQAGSGYRVFMAGWLAQMAAEMTGDPAGAPDLLTPAQALAGLNELVDFIELGQRLRFPAWMPLFDAAIAARDEPVWEDVMQRLLAVSERIVLVPEGSVGRGYKERGGTAPRRDDDPMTLPYRLLGIAAALGDDEAIQRLLADDDHVLLKASGTWAWLIAHGKPDSVAELWQRHWKAVERADLAAHAGMIDADRLAAVVDGIKEQDLVFLLRCLTASLPDTALPLREVANHQQFHHRPAHLSPERDQGLAPLRQELVGRTFTTPGARLRCLGLLLTGTAGDADLEPIVTACADHFGLRGWRQVQAEEWLAGVIRWCLAQRLRLAVERASFAGIKELFHSVDDFKKIGLQSFYEDIGRAAADPAVQARWTTEQWQTVLDVIWDLVAWDRERPKPTGMAAWTWLPAVAALHGDWQRLDALVKPLDRKNRSRLKPQAEAVVRALQALRQAEVDYQPRLDAWIKADTSTFPMRTRTLLLLHEAMLIDDGRLTAELTSRVGQENGQAAAALAARARAANDAKAELQFLERAVAICTDKKRSKNWVRRLADLKRYLQAKSEPQPQPATTKPDTKPTPPAPTPRPAPDVPSADGF